MEEKPKEPLLNQNMIIAIIGAVATIIAATIPFLISNMNKNEPAPTLTSMPPTEAPTFTSLPPTEAFTSTPEPPTATATTAVTETPVMGFYDVYLAIDPGGEVKSTTFPSGQPVYLFFSLNDPSDQRRVKYIWYAVEVEGFNPNTEVYEVEETLTRSRGSTQASGLGGGRPGKYKVELYLNGLLAATQEFEIK